MICEYFMMGEPGDLTESGSGEVRLIHYTMIHLTNSDFHCTFKGLIHTNLHNVDYKSFMMWFFF